MTRRLVATREARVWGWPRSPYVELQIFGEFTGDNDIVVLDQFHTAPWPERPAILAALRDMRMRELGEELVYLERPDLLPPDQYRRHADRHRRRVLGLDGDVPWRTLPRAIAEADVLLGTTDSIEHDRIQAHRAQLLSWQNQATTLAA